ncbi:oxidoreductase [Paenibacillus sp. NPDC058177]|uniref:oxidoreductase n=1 Tax=Paenibacillus sp. NPDC058177 TaxID=3346369 RepID=UPI0036DEA67E
MSVWFITGASRGLGAEILREAIDHGHQVVAAVRNPDAIAALYADAGNRLLAVQVDVTNEEQIQAAVETTVERFGRIDVLVNNAGRGLLSAVEEASDAAARLVFDTNVFGVLNVNRAVLPVMRAQRSGHVFNISSVGGFAQGAGWGIYGATKFALEGFSEAMHAELAPVGIKVTIVEPGYFRTDFLDSSSLHTESNIIEDYSETSGKMRSYAGKMNHNQPGDPVKAAQAILKVAGEQEPPLRLQLGSDCISRVEAKLHYVQNELNQWRELALSTDYGDAQVG